MGTRHVETNVYRKNIRARWITSCVGPRAVHLTKMRTLKVGVPEVEWNGVRNGVGPRRPAPLPPMCSPNSHLPNAARVWPLPPSGTRVKVTSVYNRVINYFKEKRTIYRHFV